MIRIIMTKIVVFIGCFLFAGTLWAYGGGGGTTSACKKPKFSDFNPVHLAEVAPESGFSFVANKYTQASDLTVTVKQKPVAVQVTPQPRGLLVTGQLPIGLAGNYARIAITAKSSSGCKGQGGWLIKVSGSGDATDAP